MVPDCNNPHLRDFRCPRDSVSGDVTTPPESSHPFGFSGWHFFDVASDVLRSGVNWVMPKLESAAGKAKALLPAARIASRTLPVIGVVGETMHVVTPYQNARADFAEGKLSFWQFAGLTTSYGVYALSGLGGLLTASIKEVATQALVRSDTLDTRYIPHTLWQELKHTGLIGQHAPASGTDYAGAPMHIHDGIRGEDCPECLRLMTAETISPDALSHLQAPTLPQNVAGFSAANQPAKYN